MFQHLWSEPAALLVTVLLIILFKGVGKFTDWRGGRRPTSKA